MSTPPAALPTGPPHAVPPQPTPARRTERKFLLAIFGLWLLLYGSFTLFTPPLLDDADSVHAEVAREMVLHHDWVTLHADGIRYLEKAPLMYWSMATSFVLFGAQDWAARLPLALYTLALFFAVYALGRALFGSAAAGFYAALILLTSFGIFIFSRITIPDVIVCLWLALAVLFFWQSLQQPRPSRLSACGFAAACALNVLTKGLIGIVFPLAIVVLYLWVTRNLGHLRRWHPLTGLLVFLLIAVPWHIAAGLANPAQGHPTGIMPTQGNVHGFFWFYFVNEQVLRYLNQRVPRDYDTVPLLLFWGLLFVWLMPWCAFAFKALRRIPLRRAVRRVPLSTEDRPWLLLGLWAALPMLFFSFSTRQEYYVLPSLPPLALVIGAWLAQDEASPKTSPTRRAGRRIAWVLFAFGTCAALVAAFFALRAHPPAPGTDLATLLSQNPADYALSFGHFLDLSGRAMGAFRTPLSITAASLLLGTLGNLFFRLRNVPRWANCYLAGMMVSFLIAAHIALVTFSPVLSSQILADAIRSELQPGDLLAVNGEYESASTLSFYLERPLLILNGRSSNLWYGSFFNDAPPLFEDDASMRRLWSGPERVFLWTEPDKVPALPDHVYVVARNGGKEIVSNQPNSSGASF